MQEETELPQGLLSKAGLFEGGEKERWMGMSITNYERIKAMSLEEMATFLAKLGKNDIIVEADRYICKRCMVEHNGRCPIADDDKCLYDNDEVTTIKMWLEAEEEDNEQREYI